MRARPKQGTPEWELWVAACEVAIYPPIRHAAHVATGAVDWDRLEALRRALDGVGIDWRSVKVDDDDARRRIAERAAAQRAAVNAERNERNEREDGS